MVEFPCEAIPSRTFVCWDLKIIITNSILRLVIGLFMLSFSSWISLDRLYISRNLSISSRLFNLLAYNWSILLWFFVFLLYQLLFLLFHFFVCVFSLFFFMSLAKGLTILFIFFPKPNPWFHWFFYYYYYFLVSILFIFSLIFLPSPDFGLCFFSF